MKRTYCKQRNYHMAFVFVTFKYRTRNPQKLSRDSKQAMYENTDK